MKIDELTLNRVKQAASIVDVIGDFYPLRKRGTTYECLCPFHGDRHEGSFKVFPKSNRYICFSCGADGDPIKFLQEHEHLKFDEAVKWLGAKYGIEVEGSSEYRDRVKTCKPRAQMPPLPTLTFPMAYVNGTQAREKLATNNLVTWLFSLPWTDEQRQRLPKMLRNYFVGASQKTGMTIFWYIDHQQQPRSGKMMLYKKDGHRNKQVKRNFTWVHSMMEKARLLDPDTYEVRICLFGQHLIDLCPDAEIYIVESEKTALICATAYGNMRKRLWLACGGLRFLTAERLAPLIERKRHIVLCPDHDAIGEWKAKAKEIDYKWLSVDDQMVTKAWRPEDGEKADIADIIVRLLQPKVSILEVMAEEHPEINDLIDAFNLEQVGDVKFIKTKQTNKNAERREISGSDDQGVARGEDKA